MPLDNEYLISFDSDRCEAGCTDIVGGKNASLGELSNLGVPVPPGFAVTTELYSEYLNRTGIADIIDESLGDVDPNAIDRVKEASELIRQEFREQSFPGALEERLDEGIRKLSEKTNSNDSNFAVRSSATTEDLPESSFAGQQDTYLGVKSPSDIKKYIRKCMGSLFTPRAITYRAKNGFDQTEPLISVGVQEMVSARSSGVMFTLNPANGDRSKARIESNWGLGESVVSGAATPDSFLVDKPSYVIVEREISQKTLQTIRTDDGVVETEVPENKQNEPSIDEDEIEELVRLGKEIEQHYGCPEDIEWAIEEESSQIYILQSRPETVQSQADSTNSLSGLGDGNLANTITDKYT